MFKKIMHTIERKIIRVFLKKVLKKENLVNMADKILDAFEEYSEGTDNVIDDEIAKHLRKALDVPEGDK